jgi:hypothetical protein
MRRVPYLTFTAILVGLFVLGGEAARASLIDHVVVEAMPTEYDGKCPASVLLVAHIRSGLDRADQVFDFNYRWESEDGLAGDEIKVRAAGRHSDIATVWAIDHPSGQTFVQSIRLHTYFGFRHGKILGEQFSTPVKVKITCR